MEYNINHIIDAVSETIERHKLPEFGCYSRYIGGPINAYGCADAANLMYTINRMPKDMAEQRAIADAIITFQREEDGIFDEGTHVVEHGTAHCLAALELFDIQPERRVSGFDAYNTPEGITALLEGFDFDNLKGSGHYGAGIFCSLFLSRQITPETKKAFFDWLNANVDEGYGMSKRGAIDTGLRPMWHHMGDWFHFLFCYHGANEPFPYPERLIDTNIRLWREDLLSDAFGRGIRFLEIDWVFSLYRAVRQCGYRFEESREILKDFAGQYITALSAVDYQTDDAWNDMHRLFGAICALAELQLALPEVIKSDYPLRQVLDRRPFI